VNPLAVKIDQMLEFLCRFALIAAASPFRVFSAS